MSRFSGFKALLVAIGPLVVAAPALAADYLLRAGDVVKIEVLEDATLNRSALIAPDGRISLPLAGGVRVAGKSIEAVQDEIAAKLAPNFATAPSVFVSLERQREVPASTGGPAAQPVIGIYVMGEAAKPGKLEVAPGSTLLQVFAQMGGFSKFAATKRIQLRRGSETFTVNYRDIEAGSSDAGSIVLRDGDVIVVPQRKLFE